MTLFSKDESFRIHTTLATLKSVQEKILRPLENKHPLVKDVLLHLGQTIEPLDKLNRQIIEMHKESKAPLDINPEPPKAA